MLSGSVVDQAALHGLLRRIRDTGLTLVSVSRMPPGASETCDGERNKAKE